MMLPSVRAKIRLPNVIGIGSARCGTSYLFGLLSGHPDFYATPLKEVNYFGIKQAPFARQGWSLDDYRLCFASQAAEKYIVEISPVYIAYPPCIQQIAGALRPVQVIVTLRDPVERLISHFNYHRSKHGYSDINHYVRDAFKQYVAGHFDFAWNTPVKALQLSLYAGGVKSAIQTLRRENVLVLLYEDLARDETIWRRQLGEFFKTDFLNVKVAATLKNPSTQGANTALSASNQSALRDFFAEDIAKLTNLLGQDLTQRWNLAAGKPTAPA